MASRGRFSAEILAAIRDGKILGLHAGREPHRFIGIWTVVVEGRVFVRSWSLKPRSWWRTLLEEPRGTINVSGEEIEIRAVRTRSARLNDAVDHDRAGAEQRPGLELEDMGLSTVFKKRPTSEVIALCPMPPSSREKGTTSSSATAAPTVAPSRL